MPTVAEQDYIKAIYKLQQSSDVVTTSALATALGVTAASASGMITKLSRARMVSHRRRRGVRLTDKGRRSAMDVVRRHRLVELFLVEVLKMPWELVHHEADRLEHAVSDEVLKRIDKLLGFPRSDPHGSPIPSTKARSTRARGTRLNQLSPGRGGVVCEVRDDDPALLKHLSKIGLIPGVRILVTEMLAVDGTRILRCGRRKCSVSPKVASAVRVEEDR